MGMLYEKCPVCSPEPEGMGRRAVPGGRQLCPACRGQGYIGTGLSSKQAERLARNDETFRIALMEISGRGGDAWAGDVARKALEVASRRIVDADPSGDLPDAAAVAGDAIDVNFSAPEGPGRLVHWTFWSKGAHLNLRTYHLTLYRSAGLGTPPLPGSAGWLSVFVPGRGEYRARANFLRANPAGDVCFEVADFDFTARLPAPEIRGARA